MVCGGKKQNKKQKKQKNRATNLPHQLDEAVLRRFAKRILVPHPDEPARLGLLRHLMSKQQHALNDKDFQMLARRTILYSCSDITLLCRDAAMGPIRDLGLFNHLMSFFSFFCV